ncbi:glucose-6-phosphate exchanger SLC37A2-like [Octopus vulgaris]|uniref:Glucose-6-phosphate exchanger SLC37A2-like n=2 Tax=Octopus TaxID=6643 RepID=A0AA36ARV3_OCTVU|nr:sugar phosphate exchanger 3 [Octopus sinensis]CAI9720523.1 glucose-6-phosphate exchanger SLC37A2-like [Octopus vulgaris]
MSSELSLLRRKQVLVFCLGWLSYASTYLLRKPLGVVKTDLEQSLNIPKEKLGWLDTALLLPYAVMQILLGSVGDKIGPRKTFGFCLVFSGLSMMTFGMWSNFSMFFILLFLNGTAQAQCWPNCVKVLGEWFPERIRNSVFGMFGTCAFGGGIIGTALAVYLQTSYGWRKSFTLPSIIVFSFGILVFVLFKQPNELNIEVPGKENQNLTEEKKKMSFLEIMKIPMVFDVALAVFCLKVVRYCMFMWLPMYLYNELKYSKSQAGIFSIAFEVGGVLGSALIGFIMDRFFSKGPLFGTGISVLLSAISLLLFSWTSHWGLHFNNVFMFLAGAFNCGPDSILGAAVPSKIGELNGRNAGAAVVGFVNGFGSIGTVIEGPIIGIASARYGWSGMFYLMIGLSLIGTLTVFKAAYTQKTIDTQNAVFQEV